MDVDGLHGESCCEDMSKTYLNMPCSLKRSHNSVNGAFLTWWVHGFMRSALQLNLHINSEWGYIVSHYPTAVLQSPVSMFTRAGQALSPITCYFHRYFRGSLAPITAKQWCIVLVAVSVVPRWLKIVMFYATVECLLTEQTGTEETLLLICIQNPLPPPYKHSEHRNRGTHTKL